MYLKTTQKTVMVFCVVFYEEYKMERVVILGSPGSGKSTLARKLGEKTLLPVIHGDKLFWHSGWIESTKEEIDSKLTAAAKDDRWIIDGNYMRTLPDRLQRADTVLYLDLPRLVCLGSVLKRILFYRGATRPDLPEGCPERIEWEFLTWVWNFNKNKRPKIYGLLEQYPDKDIHIFKSRRQVKAYVKSL